jgi:ComF family protein
MSEYIIKTFFSNILDFIAPRRCEICNVELGSTTRKFEFFCDECIRKLPPPPDSMTIMERLNYYYKSDEPVITNAYSLFVSTEHTPFMEMIYSLKYRGFSRIGIELGRELGRIVSMKENTAYDAIVPVPIHHARMRERGFNQSEKIAKGVSEIIGVPVDEKIIKRSRYTQTQTQLSAEERKKNVADVFVPFKKSEKLNGENLLLIDDVFTTGSTLFYCASKLKEIGAGWIDTATLALVGN